MSRMDSWTESLFCCPLCSWRTRCPLWVVRQERTLASATSWPSCCASGRLWGTAEFPPKIKTVFYTDIWYCRYLFRAHFKLTLLIRVVDASDQNNMFFNIDSTLFELYCLIYGLKWLFIEILIIIEYPYSYEIRSWNQQSMCTNITRSNLVGWCLVEIATITNFV